MKHVEGANIQPARDLFSTGAKVKVMLKLSDQTDLCCKLAVRVSLEQVSWCLWVSGHSGAWT